MWPDIMKGQLRKVYWLLNTDTKILIFYFQCHVSPAKKPKVASKTESSAQQWNNNHLITGPNGNSEFCFPETLSVARGEAMGTLRSRGSKTHFPAELAIKCFVIPPNSKIENKTEKNRLLDIGWQTNLLQFTWSGVSRKFKLLNP